MKVFHDLKFAERRTACCTSGLTAMCILYNQRDGAYAVFFIIINALHVSGGFSAHHQELIKLYVQPWVLSCFHAVYCLCTYSNILISLKIAECRTPTPQDVQKKGSKILKLPRFTIVLH